MADQRTVLVGAHGHRVERGQDLAFEALGRGRVVEVGGTVRVVEVQDPALSVPLAADEVRELDMLDLEAGVLHPLAPLADAVVTHMAGVAPLLEAVHEQIQLLVIRGHVVVEHEQPARPQHPRHLANILARVGEVVRGDPRRHYVEAGVGERQRLGIGDLERDIGRALLADERLGDLDHARRQVGRQHLAHIRREGQRGVPAAGGNIQQALVAARLCQLDHARQVAAVRMNRAGDIALRHRAELGLNQIFDA